jgi:translation initiation factor 1
MTKDTELVYSTDSSLNKHCDRCKKIIAECSCVKNTLSASTQILRVIIRIEKAHRGGKDVTVIDKLPPDENFIKDLAQKLKKQSGTGGTFKIIDNAGMIEIQGDKREQLRKELEKQGIRCR